MNISDLQSFPNIKIEVSINDLKQFAQELILEYSTSQTLEKEEIEEGIDKLLTLTELREFLPDKPARQTCYQWCFNRQIPFEKHGRNLYFRKSTIQNWLDAGRQMKHLKE